MSEPPSKRSQNEDDESLSKDDIIKQLKEKIATLESQVKTQQNDASHYYSSQHASLSMKHQTSIPENGMAAGHVSEKITQYHSCDFNPRLNTSSYVNVVSEPEEREVAILGSQVNLADGSVYPASVAIHDTVVNMIAILWNAPPPKTGSNYCGAGTVGSTEACLLAGLALKFRWREWYAKRIGKGVTDEAVVGIRPNLVISTCYQAAWEKFFRYFDVTPKFCKPNLVQDKMAIDASKIAELCDEQTIGVVGILGNHYNGAYDPVWDIDKEVKKINKEKGFQIGVHIDAASGGFIAPFQEEMKEKEFDFRLESVMSISASGHKFGESICGTGWVVFRHREDLGEHIAVTVTYLGGHSDSMTLNFSRPASGVYVQYYKLLRLGIAGYTHKVANQMKVAKFIRDYLRNAKDSNGMNRFQILDQGDEGCLPVVSARLNPELKKGYDDIDMQHALSESHWYVSGYHLGFTDPCKEHVNGDDAEEALCTDVPIDGSMFRVVVKSNLTMQLAEDLVEHFDQTLPILDSLGSGYNSMHLAKEAFKSAKEYMEHPEKLDTVVVDAQKWLQKSKTVREKIVGHKGHLLRKKSRNSFSYAC